MSDSCVTKVITPQEWDGGAWDDRQFGALVRNLAETFAWVEVRVKTEAGNWSEIRVRACQGTYPCSETVAEGAAGPGGGS
jgi:hypothetical protein